MIRKIVKIDPEKCNGCGLCISGCHEGALQLIGGKATLVSESYCDGLGACLPECPTGAISIEEREAAVFDETEVQKRMEAEPNRLPEKLACGCPGMNAKILTPKPPSPTPTAPVAAFRSQLRQWPCQIKLAPVNAPYFENAHLLVAADCTAYAYANIHNDFMKNKITLIGCPKLDEGDYAGKITEILQAHEIKSVTVLRMEVPCCGGMVAAVKKALLDSRKLIPWNVVTIGADGEIVED
jgi:NAD-dependent dihydropyrimidine dehydrogenase PreA subunit